MRTINVESFGHNAGRGDPSEDTTAITAALTALNGSSERRVALVFPSPVVYYSRVQLTISRPDVDILVGVPGVTTLAAPTDATQSFLMRTYGARTVVKGLVLDVNGANRAGTLRLHGLRMEPGSDDSVIQDVTIHGVRGGSDGSGNAFAAVESDRVKVLRCHCEASPASDGFYVQGNEALIEDCTGYGWGDTLAVLEGSSNGIIRRIQGSYGGALFAVSNFTDADHADNLVIDATGDHLTASVSGGSQVATLGTAGGKLLRTTLTNIELSDVTGPGLRLYQAAGAGIVDVVTLTNVAVYRSTLQGFLAHAGRTIRGDILVHGAVGTNAVQITDNAEDVDITMDVETANPISGVAVIDCPDVTLRGAIHSTLGTTTYGAYFYGTNANARESLTVTGCVNAFDSDAGTTVTSI